jgi:hypothetical protein
VLADIGAAVGDSLVTIIEGFTAGNRLGVFVKVGSKDG